MQAPAEAQVRVWLARKLDLARLGKHLRVMVRGRNAKVDVLARFERVAAPLVVHGDLARHRTCGAADAHELVESRRIRLRVIAQPDQEVRVLKQERKGIDQQRGRRLAPAEEQ